MIYIYNVTRQQQHVIICNTANVSMSYTGQSFPSCPADDCQDRLSLFHLSDASAQTHVALVHGMFS